ncbi:sugar epimerase [Salinimicrobium sp. HB62]|uniref:sugar epimerase n=1 Tax=Salinimicrobium sp. HB62 TaxID=3077781 RepID=UPI002D79F61F|nr:sugar epimerase [Salinimicrobium sp. HB62]
MTENVDISFIRGWQGHKIEQRWFSAVNGCFKIELRKIDSNGEISEGSELRTFILHSEKLDVLHVPAGYVSAIKAQEENSKLLAMADHFTNEVQDEVRWEKQSN